jgi:hypothetical protein
VLTTADDDGEGFDAQALLAGLRGKLPAFMLPSHMARLPALPTLPSGKVDRKRLPRVLGVLPASQPPCAGARRPAALPPLQQHVLGAFEKVLGAPAASLCSPGRSFFELGGNSLLVSRLVTELRSTHPAITSRDVYAQPTLEGLAGVLTRLSEGDKGLGVSAAGGAGVMAPRVAERRRVHVPGVWQTRVADLLQTLALYFTAAYLGLNSMPVYILYFAYRDWPALRLGAFLGGVSLLTMLAALVINVAVKWVVLGRVREGEYPLWGAYHLRFWFAQSLDDLFRAHYAWLLQGTPLALLYHRLMGSAVGRGAHIEGVLDGWDLVSVGEGATLNVLANVSAVAVEDNMLKLRPVRVGAGATVGVRAMVQPGASVGEGSKVEALSLVPGGEAIPPRERWAGAPAVFASKVAPPAADYCKVSAWSFSLW